MLYSLETSNQNLAYFHCPKPSCPFCLKDGRRFIRYPGFKVISDIPSLQFESNNRHCEYHSIQNFLQTQNVTIVYLPPQQ